MKHLLLLSSGILGLVLSTAAQTATPAATTAPPPTQSSPAVAIPPAAPAAASVQTPAVTANTGADADTTAVPPATAPAVAAEKPAPTPKLGPDEIMLNFKNAPIESVLKYLSDAAGFIIVVRTPSELRGKITVFSSHPIT